MKKDALATLGIISILFGIGMISWPLALIVLGCGMTSGMFYWAWLDSKRGDYEK